MQLTVFSTDTQKTGFRLQYLEVFNWGTFNERVWRIEPGGETSLLTGANGSGKTTFVDALLTLLVPERRMRFYNQSSGSEKKGDRSEDTYVLGAYGTVPADSGSGMKTLYLRESRETAYSILLAHFANEAQQLVTLFQVRYFSGGEMKRVYGISHKALSIEADFVPFDLSGGWKRRLDHQYNRAGHRSIEWPDSAARYAHRITEVLGMQGEQALSLFNQTVGIKVLGDLNEFIRTNMLEPRNMEQEFQDLKKQLATLLEAQRNLEKIALQIDLLRPLAQQFQRYEAATRTLAEAQRELELAKVWYKFTRFHLLQAAMDTGREQEGVLSRQLEEIGGDLARLQEEERRVQNQIEGNKAGQRLQQLQTDLEEFKQKHRRAEQALAAFTNWCVQLHLPESEVPDEAAYNRVRKEASRKGLTLNRESGLADEDRWSGKQLKERAGKELAAVEDELSMLLQHRNNIPAQLIALRQELCSALKLNAAELPFAGELMQVKSEEMEWQPALEKLLHGFALRLLVPEKHYKKVAQYVNRTNLGARLIFYAVHEVLHLEHPHEGSVSQKLDFLQDHKLWKWLAVQLQRQFQHQCLENEQELERHDFAITLNGLIKSRDRHEKDDRPERNDAARFVMGWSNERKKEALRLRRAKLLEEVQEGTALEEKGRRKCERLQKDMLVQQRIIEHEGFAVIDTAAIQRSLRKTEEAIAALQASSNQLQALTTQLKQILEERGQTNVQRDTLVGDIRALQERLRQQENDLAGLVPLIQVLQEADKDNLLRYQQRHAASLANVELNNLQDYFDLLKGAAEKQIEAVGRERSAAEREAQYAIGKLKSPEASVLQRFPEWVTDVHPFPREVEFAQEYVEWLERLEADNLPRFREEFERLLQETAVHKIGLLNEELEQWERKIRYSIDLLNQSLSGIQFNRLPDTIIRLVYRQVPDSTIKEFRSRLIGALPDQKAWQQSPFEEKEAHFRERVQPLIGMLDESESYRGRVLDVRNWFEFWADELYRNTGELKKSYRQMGQLSGGEKAQLTYTILCSAIAYQFGITKDGHNARSLRFIAVDESFSNQDEEKATYLMELCRQLHLQLLVVTPSDKIQIVENFIAHIHLVQRRHNGESILYNMTKKELQQQRAALTADEALPA
ncbi:MAG: hypothetical protein EOO15_02990 [Chitinophagaceae bacterium]|nr:MAG: hypothetical protein EOO15_02990 [Chitinophagaceae bacterium]